MFKKAVKLESNSRVCIIGPSGSGKTYTSLVIASNLCGDGKIAVVDTERGSASKYADEFDFDVLELSPPFEPKKFVDAIKEAEKAGYNAIILDSLTHAWAGSGGILDINTDITMKSNARNSYFAWRETTPLHNQLVDSMLGAKMHVFATMRSKQEYVIEEVRGKQVPRKVGMAPVQREGMEYEFDVVLEMNADNNGVVTKSRCKAITGKVYKHPNGEISDALSLWLKGKRPTISKKVQDRFNQVLEESGIPLADQLKVTNEMLGSEFQAINELTVEEAKKVIDKVSEEYDKAQAKQDSGKEPEYMTNSQAKTKHAKVGAILKDKAKEEEYVKGWQKDLATATLGRKVTTYTEITSEEADKVITNAELVAQGKLVLAEDRLVDAETGHIKIAEKSHLGDERIEEGLDELPA